MKHRIQHILGIILAMGLLVTVLGASPSGVTHAPPGTRIANEARARFLYKTGVPGSVRSNVAETIVLPAVVSTLLLEVSPHAIIGNGSDTASIRATALDAAGQPVPDATPVTFTTSRGSFPGDLDTLTVPTTGGVAAMPLRSEVVSQDFVTADIAARAMGEGGSAVTVMARVLFYPGAMRGTARSAIDGNPVAGVVAAVYDGSQNEISRDTTRADGSYLIPLRSSGLYSRTLIYTNRFGDRVLTSTSLALQIPASGGIPPVIAPGAISGCVLDPSTSQPVRMAGIPVVMHLTGGTHPPVSSAVPDTQWTDAHGVFVFDSLAAGSYELRAVHPRYTGSLALQNVPEGSFTVEANISVSEQASLELVKTSSKRIAEIGDAVFYTLVLRNGNALSPIHGLRIIDDLPFGFVYSRGTTRLDRQVTPDPEGSRHIEWVLPDTLQPGESVRLSYAATIGAAALDGDGINRARGSGEDFAGNPLHSNEASVQVAVRPGIFTDRGIVIGKVYYDRNANGWQEEGEDGIPGVALWMEDGSHIITGDDGKYSLPDVKPGQHVIRMDRRTLPAGTRLLAHGTEFAGDASSRFIRLIEGGIARADFYVIPVHRTSSDTVPRRSPVEPRERRGQAHDTLSTKTPVHTTSAAPVGTTTRRTQNFPAATVAGDQDTAPDTVFSGSRSTQPPGGVGNAEGLSAGPGNAGGASGPVRTEGTPSGTARSDGEPSGRTGKAAQMSAGTGSAAELSPETGNPGEPAGESGGADKSSGPFHTGEGPEDRHETRLIPAPGHPDQRPGSPGEPRGHDDSSGQPTGPKERPAPGASVRAGRETGESAHRNEAGPTRQVSINDGSLVQGDDAGLKHTGTRWDDPEAVWDQSGHVLPLIWLAIARSGRKLMWAASAGLYRSIHIAAKQAT